MQRNLIMQRFIDREIAKALVNSRLEHDHPMRDVLDKEAEIVGDRACVRVIDESGGWVMLEDRIRELKADSRFRHSIPNPTRVARNDESGIRGHFNAIAEGSAVIE